MWILLAVGFVGAVVYQWLTQEVTLKIFGPWRVSFFRDEWPAFFWMTLALEVGFAGLCVYWFFV